MIPKASSDQLRAHLIREHSAFECAAPPDLVPIPKAFQKSQSIGNIAEMKAALAYCFNPGMAFRIADDPWFKQGYGRPIEREEIPLKVASMQHILKERIAAKMRGAEVALCLDGWTSYRHRKFVNMVLMHEGTAVFWRSYPSNFGKSAAVLRLPLHLGWCSSICCTLATFRAISVACIIWTGLRDLG
jgi:hypothetical protein